MSKSWYNTIITWHEVEGERDKKLFGEEMVKKRKKNRLTLSSNRSLYLILTTNWRSSSQNVKQNPWRTNANRNHFPPSEFREKPSISSTTLTKMIEFKQQRKKEDGERNKRPILMTSCTGEWPMREKASPSILVLVCDPVVKVTPISVCAP